MCNLKKILILSSVFLLLVGCKNGKLPGADARKFPADPKQRVKKNLEEGRGFTLNKAFGSDKRGGTFDFASSNELWRASLDVIDFVLKTIIKPIEIMIIARNLLKVSPSISTAILAPIRAPIRAENPR